MEAPDRYRSTPTIRAGDPARGTREAAPGGGFFAHYFPFGRRQKVVAGLCLAAMGVLLVLQAGNESVTEGERPGESEARVAVGLYLAIGAVKVVEHAFLRRPRRESRGTGEQPARERQARHDRIHEIVLLLLVAGTVSFGLAVAAGYSIR